ncbi:membrane hypothetical protein [Vibrio jasicida]|uniref:hypothetical protein n=1 Tax=Vibrio jasicida TaxID=766224 RepID=UPI0028945457|nr:membrane hypothetical protein [Vibrio jasicida]
MNNELSTFKRITAIITGIAFTPIFGAILVTTARTFGSPNGVWAAMFVIYAFGVFMAHDRLFNDYKFINSASTPFKRRFRKALSGYSVYSVIMLSIQLVLLWAR